MYKKLTVLMAGVFLVFFFVSSAKAAEEKTGTSFMESKGFISLHASGFFSLSVSGGVKMP